MYQSMADMNEYFSGEKLYGDDFSFEQIQKWYDQEAESYANMYGKNTGEKDFSHRINILYGFKYLKNIPVIECALGLGSSWGYEFMPVIDTIKELQIIDSSQQTVSQKLGNLKPIYHLANISGKIDFPDNTFELIIVFSTLHHIPNVTFVLNELFRVLKPGGYMLLKEPVNSMGDWRMKRDGLTVNERGIPPHLLKKMIKNVKLQIVARHYFHTMASFLMRITHNNTFFQSKTYLLIDKYLSKILSFNMHYHPVNKIQRICPQAVFYVLKKNT
jgi:ubiquinone/menaquinone biosynthesis C-methylase UbiE